MEVTGNAVELYSQRQRKLSQQNHTPTISGRGLHNTLQFNMYNQFPSEMRHASQRMNTKNVLNLSSII